MQDISVNNMTLNQKTQAFDRTTWKDGFSSTILEEILVAMRAFTRFNDYLDKHSEMRPSTLQSSG